MVKKSVVSVLAMAAGLSMAGVAHADSVIGDFHTQLIGATSQVIPTLGTVTFTLKGDGTIGASLNLNSYFNGILSGFAFNSPNSSLQESSFSDPHASVTPGFSGPFGTLRDGFSCPVNTACVNNVTWTIGTPNEFTSVKQALGGLTGSVDFYVQGANGIALTANAVSAVPEPEIAAMMLAGLGVLGLVARRRAGPMRDGDSHPDPRPFA
jgi:hypothetical protein